ncbi:MAG: PAS domain S-box protein, partial [Planctomycetota bacterium]
LHPDDVQRTLEVWNRAVATRTPYETEYRMRRHDGAYRVLLARGVPILDDNGSVTEWVGTCIDITERKAAEQALRQAHDELEARVGERTAELAKAHAAVDAERRRFKDVLDQLPAYLVLLTPDYQVPFANRFFEERFGKADGRRCYEYLFNRTTPCEACETFTVLETHQPHHWEWTGPDGRHYDIHDFPFTDVDGSPLIMEVGLDITERKRAEAALRELNETLELRVAERTAALHESEEKFRSAFANATIGMAMTTPAGHFVAANSAYCALTGYGLDELREMKFAQLIHPDDLAENEGLNERMMAGESADFVVENRYLRKDGRLVWVRKSVSLVRAPQGAPQWIIALVEDITARKEAEAELEWLASFPVRNPNPIFEVDLNGRVTYVNPAGEKSFPDLTQRGTEHPALADWPDLVRGCDASRGGYLGHREVRAGDCWYSQTLSYLADAQRLRVYNLDITARKQAEEALRLSRQDLDRAQAVGQIGWWRLDTRRNVLTWSDENYRIFGLPAATPLTYETFMATVHPDDRAYVDAQWRAGLRGAPYDLEHRIVADGRVKWVREKAYLEFDAAGQLLGGFGITQDITARKALELERDQLLEAERAARSEAERASRLKDEFLATLSHELRTPLGAVLGWAQMLQRGRLSTEEAQEAVATIEKNARLQKQLIDDLLDMGRVVSGKLKLELQPVEIAVVARDAVAMFRPEAEQKGVELRAMIRVASGQVLGDQGRLKQMIGNLLSNAIKFTSRGGDVRVIVAPRRGERVLIAVKDTGIGIAPDFLPHLFERFRQADASITRKYRGLGLGLAIVKQLVELHGGGVRAKSKGEGHGATFTIELPLLSNWSVKTEEAGPFAQPPGEVDLTGIRALVVDDEPATLALVGRILKECGVQTLCCASAGEAFEALVRAEFNVLVSDISMPGEDGYSLIRRIRALEDGRRSAIPAIALTAFIRPEDRRRAFEAGFEAHMTKPVDAAELCALVGRLARRFGVH